MRLLAILFAIACLTGCGPTRSPGPSSQTNDLNGRSLTIISGGEWCGKGFSVGERSAFYTTTEYSVNLRENELFVNDLYYGLTQSNDTIRIADGRITVNEKERKGTFPTPEQRERLHPTVYEDYAFQGHLVLAVSPTGDMARVKPAFGAGYLEINGVQIRFAEGQIVINGEPTSPVTKQDVLYATPGGVFVLKDALRGKSGWTRGELAALADKGTELVRLWPCKAHVELKERIWF